VADFSWINWVNSRGNFSVILMDILYEFSWTLY
jgi:hypothetical protein